MANSRVGTNGCDLELRHQDQDSRLSYCLHVVFSRECGTGQLAPSSTTTGSLLHWSWTLGRWSSYNCRPHATAPTTCLFSLHVVSSSRRILIVWRDDRQEWASNHMCVGACVCVRGVCVCVGVCGCVCVCVSGLEQWWLTTVVCGTCVVFSSECGTGQLAPFSTTTGSLLHWS